MTRAIYRNSRPRFSKGTPVVMSDGWVGKIVEEADGFGIVCLHNGERPDENWAGPGYRFVNAGSITIKSSTAVVAWKGKPPATAPQRSQQTRGDLAAVVADHARARLEREWESVPD